MSVFDVLTEMSSTIQDSLLSGQYMSSFDVKTFVVGIVARPSMKYSHQKFNFKGPSNGACPSTLMDDLFNIL